MSRELVRMGGARKLPDYSELVKLREKGLTDAEIAEWIYEHTGERVARSTVTAAFSRRGAPSKKPRYLDVLPWRVSREHRDMYPARMLRLVGRKQAGNQLSPEEETKLKAWLRMLKEHDVVVHYEPRSDLGWWYIPRDTEDGDGLIRRPKEQE